jgi:hypothetical protein
VWGCTGGPVWPEVQPKLCREQRACVQGSSSQHNMPGSSEEELSPELAQAQGLLLKVRTELRSTQNKMSHPRSIRTTRRSATD